MELESVMRERHATRKFSDKKIEKEKLDKILEAGRIAPTAKNLQPIKIYVVEDKIEELDQATPCRYNAPTVLVVCGNKEEAFQKENHSTYEMDSVITATHMMLEATNVGVANIWVEMFQEEILRNLLDIPTNLVPVCLLPMGYEAEDAPESPNHHKRKSIEEIIEYR
jgi:nitroreductase